MVQRNRDGEEEEEEEEEVGEKLPSLRRLRSSLMNA